MKHDKCKYLFLNSILIVSGLAFYAVTSAHAQPAAKGANRYPERPVRVVVLPAVAPTSLRVLLSTS